MSFTLFYVMMSIAATCSAASCVWERAKWRFLFHRTTLDGGKPRLVPTGRSWEALGLPRLMRNSGAEDDDPPHTSPKRIVRSSVILARKSSALAFARSLSALCNGHGSAFKHTKGKADRIGLQDSITNCSAATGCDMAINGPGTPAATATIQRELSEISVVGQTTLLSP